MKLKFLYAAASTLLAASGTVFAQGNGAIFVDLTTVTAPAATETINTPAGAGTGTYGFSAANQFNAGTTWNNAPLPAATVLSAGQSGNPSSGTPAGTYNLYSSPLSLVDSSGAATSATLQVAIAYNGTTTRNGISSLNLAGSNLTGVGPHSAMLSDTWRNQGGSTWTFTISGLQSSTSYALDFYGTGNATGQRLVSATVDPSNTPDSVGTTLGSNAPISIFTAVSPNENTLRPEGEVWDRVNATSTAGGVVSFTVGTGDNFFNGFQIAVPEPATGVMVLGGAGMLFALRRRRSSLGRLG